MEDKQIKQIIEALIFSSAKPLPLNQIDEVMEKPGHKIIKEKIAELNCEYETVQRPYRIREIAGGFVLATLEEFAPWLKKLYKTQNNEKLSASALETLAIIVYKQPITKPEIEFIRGVNADGMIKRLIDKNLVKISGRKDAPGRPFLYSTTMEFLKHFGLAKLEELPPIEEFGNENIEIDENDLLVEPEMQNAGSINESEKETC
ncbi:MAG: SMC-Scp complex subunit ScpB [Candidatus Omnitrophota bacterium]